MTAGMKVYSASFSRYGSYGAFKDAHYVVIANTESEALGLALVEDKDTDAGGWTIEEIDTSKVGAHYMQASES